MPLPAVPLPAVPLPAVPLPAVPLPAVPLLAASLLAAALAAVPASAASGRRVTDRDPAGGPRWSLTPERDRAGRTCSVLRHGSVRKGRTCARLSSRSVYHYVIRRETVPNAPRATRTVLSVTFSSAVLRARLATPDGSVTYRRGRGAPAMLAVLGGHVERPALRVVVRVGGGRRILREAPPPALQVADPFGGAAWRTAFELRSGGRACVRWERVPPRFARVPSPARGEQRCGDGSEALPAATAERVGGRLVVLGVAGPQTRGVVLHGAGAPRGLALERSTRAFLAILPASTDAARLRVVAHVQDAGEAERAVDVVGRR